MHLPWRDVAPGPGPAIPTSLLDVEAARLAEFAEDRDVLEIGSAYGYSTVIMALADARVVVTVDPHTAHDSYGALHANLGMYNVSDRVWVLRGTSQAELPHFNRGAERRFDLDGFDLVFVDGDHTAAGVEHDVTAALQLLRPGGVLACHDYGEDCCCPEVRPTLDRLFPDGPDELVGTLFVVKT